MQFSARFGFTSLSLAAIVTYGGETADAAAITWSAPTTITTADAALSQPGTIVGAEAWGGGNTTVTLSNGTQIYFQQGANNGSDSFVSTSGSRGVSSGNAAAYHGTTNSNFNSVLGDFQYDGTQTMSFNNLVVGKSYTIQLFALDDRGCCSNTVEYFSDGLGNNSQSFLLGDNQYVLGSFTATASTQSVFVANGAGQIGGGGDPETNLNAAVLYSAVPEPASLTLFGPGLAAMGALRRRSIRRSNVALRNR